ncbi:MAG TPA: G/U mismatch-specific DNA glycosylase [Thermoanaerobaculia bacterium]|nr:G/U mismatch-specific DNA glycosylase [Thermoanaerobaculia bacterium]
MTQPTTQPLPDHLAPELAIVFCGINPGRTSGARGHHYAGPGNRFWPALHGAGLTPRRYRPEEGPTLPELGLGLTNLVHRTTAAAAELRTVELVAGARRLETVLLELRPRWLAVLGLGAYRVAWNEPDARVGEQPSTIGSTRVWLLPNPSGRGTHYPLPALVAELERLRKAAGLPHLSAC